MNISKLKETLMQGVIIEEIEINGTSEIVSGVQVLNAKSKKMILVSQELEKGCQYLNLELKKAPLQACVELILNSRDKLVLDEIANIFLNAMGFGVKFYAELDAQIFGRALSFYAQHTRTARKAVLRKRKGIISMRFSEKQLKTEETVKTNCEKSITEEIIKYYEKVLENKQADLRGVKFYWAKCMYNAGLTIELIEKNIKLAETISKQKSIGIQRDKLSESPSMVEALHRKKKLTTMLKGDVEKNKLYTRQAILFLSFQKLLEDEYTIDQLRKALNLHLKMNVEKYASPTYDVHMTYSDGSMEVITTTQSRFESLKREMEKTKFKGINHVDIYLSTQKMTKPCATKR